MADTHVTIVGNLVDDPEIRTTPQGAAVASLRVAVTARVKDGDGWRDGETSFYRVTAWRSLAENAGESLSKGDRVIVVGTLRQRSWETDAGEKRSVIEVTADELGPSLKWATARAEKTGTKERVGAVAGPRSGGQFNDDPPF